MPDNNKNKPIDKENPIKRRVRMIEHRRSIFENQLKRFQKKVDGLTLEILDIESKHPEIKEPK